MASAYVVATTYSGFTPALGFLGGMAPHINQFFQKLGDKIGKKLTRKNLTNIIPPDVELSCKIFEQIKYSDLSKNLVSDLLLNILVKSMDGNSKEEKSDYFKYISVINSLFPKSLVLLYTIGKDKVLLEAESKYIFEYQDGKCAEGKIITDKEVEEIVHYQDIKYRRKKIKGKIEHTLLINNKDTSQDLKYTADLERGGLIFGKEEEESKQFKPLYFEFNNTKHAFDRFKGVSLRNAKKVDKFDKYYKYLIYKKFETALTDMGKYMLDN